MTRHRKPAAFRVEPDPDDPPTAVEAGPPARPPRALPAGGALAVPDAVDAFAEADPATAPPPPATPRRRRLTLGSAFFAGLGVLLSLTTGLWVDSLIRALFARADWLGWLAAGAATVAAAALLAILLREAAALARLASVEALRERAADAMRRDDARLARSVVAEVSALLSGRPETAAGRRMLAGLDGDIIDGASLVRLAEAELLAPLDARARLIVLDAAKRVSLVTAVSPRALVDIAYVVFEAGRLIRRLAELYGGRPGTLGFFRLARSVLSHLAVTGSVAVGDSVVQQILGHGLAARLSARLGEGVVNGMMTARIGIAAIETVRPLPFSALKRPGMSDFLASLSRFARARAEEAGSEPR